MNKDVQREITLACIALLRKNVASPSKDRKRNVLAEPKTKKEAIELLLKVGREPEITFENVTDALWIVYKRSKPASQTRQWVTELLMKMVEQENILASDAIEAATALYLLSPQDSPEQQEGIQCLLTLAKRRDIPFCDTVEAAHSLYVQSPRKSQEHLLAIQALLTQACWSDTTVAQAQEAALALCYASGYRSKAREQAILTLIALTRRPDLSFEDAIVLDDQRATQGGTRALVRQQWVAKKQMWETIAQRTNLTAEQRAQAIEACDDYRWLLKERKN